MTHALYTGSYTKNNYRNFFKKNVDEDHSKNTQ